MIEIEACKARGNWAVYEVGDKNTDDDKRALLLKSLGKQIVLSKHRDSEHPFGNDKARENTIGTLRKEARATG